MSINPEIGRVLRASTAGFAVGSRVQQLQIPAFGGLVKADTANNETIYGLIYNIHVDDDPLVRRLVMAETLRPEAVNDQRTNRLLPIEMSVLAIGYKHGNGNIVQGYPPRPPLNLDPVVMVTDEDEVRTFTNKTSYLRLILRAEADNLPIDQLLVAHIRDMYTLRGDDSGWVTMVIQEVIELLRSNYETLIPTLEALSEALPVLPITLTQTD